MADAGFVHAGRFVPVDGVMQGRSYFDERGPLDPDWRAGDSIWALVNNEELDRALARVKEMDASGELTDFVKQNDAGRSDIGQFTFVCAHKPSE